MAKNVVKYRRPLNSDQLVVLRLLYCYRFGTCKYIARYLGKNDIKVVHKKLKVLEDQEFIAKRYDKSYKLLGKPAEYYLTPKGARLLMGNNDQYKNNAQKITQQGIKNLYKNSTVSTDYVAHCINILKVSLQLSELYGEKLQFFTRMQMIPFNYLPAWRPDGLISLKTRAKGKGAPKRFFLDVWDGTRPYFVSVRKVRSYIKYSEEGDWPTDEADLPIVLMLCDAERDEIKLRRQIRRSLSESYEEVSYATVTMGTLFATTQRHDRIWRIVDEDTDSEIKPQHLSALTSE
jgi:Replication-relaxation